MEVKTDRNHRSPCVLFRVGSTQKSRELDVRKRNLKAVCDEKSYVSQTALQGVRRLRKPLFAPPARGARPFLGTKNGITGYTKFLRSKPYGKLQIIERNDAVSIWKNSQKMLCLMYLTTTAGVTPKGSQTEVMKPLIHPVRTSITIWR